MPICLHVTDLAPFLWIMKAMRQRFLLRRELGREIPWRKPSPLVKGVGHPPPKKGTALFCAAFLSLTPPFALRPLTFNGAPSLRDPRTFLFENSFCAQEESQSSSVFTVDECFLDRLLGRTDNAVFFLFPPGFFSLPPSQRKPTPPFSNILRLLTRTDCIPFFRLSAPPPLTSKHKFFHGPTDAAKGSLTHSSPLQHFCNCIADYRFFLLNLESQMISLLQKQFCFFLSSLSSVPLGWVEKALFPPPSFSADFQNRVPVKRPWKGPFSPFNKSLHTSSCHLLSLFFLHGE